MPCAMPASTRSAAMPSSPTAHITFCTLMEFLRPQIFSMVLLGPSRLDLRLDTEDARRLHHQHEDQQHEGVDVLVGSRDEAGAETFDHSDHQPTQNGTRQAAEATDHGGGERLDEHTDTHLHLHVVDGADKDA